MSSPEARSQPSSSRIRETWRSALSWTLWLLRSPQRALERRRTARRLELQALLQQTLLEALRPLAAALQRQDQLLLQQVSQLLLDLRLLHPQMEEQTDLLREVLSSLQPTAQEQLLDKLDPTRPSWSPSSAR